MSIIKNLKYESDLQIQIINYLNLRKILYCASSQGFKLSIKSALKAVKMGYVKGFPDIIIYEPKGKFHGMAIEMKRNGGDISREQIWWRDQLIIREYHYFLCNPKLENYQIVNETINEINRYMELK